MRPPATVTSPARSACPSPETSRSRRWQTARCAGGRRSRRRRRATRCGCSASSSPRRRENAVASAAGTAGGRPGARSSSSSGLRPSSMSASGLPPVAAMSRATCSSVVGAVSSERTSSPDAAASSPEAPGRRRPSRRSSQATPDARRGGRRPGRRRSGGRRTSGLGGRPVHPLQVVDDDRDRRFLGVPAEQAEGCGTDREPVDGGAGPQRQGAARAIPCGSGMASMRWSIGRRSRCRAANPMSCSDSVPVARRNRTPSLCRAIVEQRRLADAWSPVIAEGAAPADPRTGEQPIHDLCSASRPTSTCEV